MSGLSPVAGEKFTDVMLAKNFQAIAAGFQDVERWVGHINEHVDDLFDLAEKAAKVKKPSRVKPFLLGAAAGVFVYRWVKNNGHKPIVAAVNNWASDVNATVEEKVEDITTAPRD